MLNSYIIEFNVGVKLMYCTLFRLAKKKSPSNWTTPITKIERLKNNCYYLFTFVIISGKDSCIGHPR